MKNEYFWTNEKVLLRAFKASDADMLYDALCDMSICMQDEEDDDPAVLYEMAEEMIQHAIEMTMEHSQLWFAVTDHENRLVGYAIMGYLDERNGNAQCDVTIFPKYRGKGFGKSTYEILLRYAFYERRMHKVNTFIMEDNEDGKHIVSEAGFSLEAHREEQFFDAGQYFAQEYYGILKEEFANPVLQGKNVSVNEMVYEQPKETVIKNVRGLSEDRSYFWSYKNILVREMTEGDYLKNREMLFVSRDARFYDNDVKLPPVTEGLTQREEAHLGFGGDGTRLEFAVVNLQGEYVGNVNLHSIDQKNGTFSISFYFLHKERKKGYATNAVALIVYYAFNELRLNKLNVRVNERNEASAKLIQKIGCKPEGVWRENVFYEGRYINVGLYGITREEFNSFLE